MQRERERERQGARPREEGGGAQEALLGAGAGAGEGASVAENGTVAASGTAADGGEANTVEAHVGGGGEEGEGNGNGGGGGPDVFALIIDGKSLAYALEGGAELRARWLALAMQCASVVCCRVSPKQKALVRTWGQGDTGNRGLGGGRGDGRRLWGLRRSSSQGQVVRRERALESVNRCCEELSWPRGVRYWSPGWLQRKAW